METENSVLVVVDMQNDFVYGALGSEDARAIVPAVVDRVKNFKGSVVFTMDTHSSDYLQTEEGRMLPVVHCVKGEDGHKIIAELNEYTKGQKVIEKPTFGSLELGEYLLKLNASKPIDKIYFVGLCTDICVVSNVLLVRAFLKDVPLYVEKDLTAGTSDENYNASLAVMRSCLVNIE